MAAIYSNGGNRWNILGFNFTKRDALSSVYKISMITQHCKGTRGLRGWKKLKYKGPHRPNAIRQRDANFQFLKTNKTVNA